MSECTINASDYSSCIILKHKNIIARKEHFCNECKNVIKARTEYEYYVGVSDGDFHIHKTCLDCVSLRDTFFPSGGCLFEYVQDYVAAQIESLRGEISNECILPLTDKAKEFVFNQIEKAWENETR